ncbi:hypothetical protein GJ744_002925 [Endocarpon pusillum]|uniref:Uncharacterized protein n=1 Tax=Endocarpon pusillum TaxID=364733 RepID=A0A8H7DZN9_9EURO|nr:hypothetical protein GJ744_002925 [Endocarpon pusillum]
MTGAEAAERDANTREQAIAQGARQKVITALAASSIAGLARLARSPPSAPPPPSAPLPSIAPSTAATNIENVPDNPPRGFVTAAAVQLPLSPPPPQRFVSSSQPLMMKKEKEKEEEAIDEAFTPPSTAPAEMTPSRSMTQSRAGRKRAPQ